MQLRKLVQSGPSSFTVSLPRKWVDLHNLKRGDVVTLQDLPDRVIITPDHGRVHRREVPDLTILIDEKPFRTIQRDIRAAYLHARRIIICGKTLREHLTMIKREVSSLVALEVVEESRTQLVCRNFVSLGDVTVENLIRRIDNIVRSMFLDLSTCLGSPDIAEEIRERDASVNRINFLILKCLRTALLDPEALAELKLTPPDLIMYWDLSVQLEKIGDEVKRAARLFARLRPNAAEQSALMSLIKQVTAHYELMLKSFYTKDASLSDEVALEQELILGLCDKHLTRHKGLVEAELIGKIKSILSHVRDISRLVRYLVVG